MARYRFNITDGHETAADLEGSQFANDGAARTDALRAIREMLSTSDKLGLCRRHWCMEVVDEHGTEIFNIPFGHALRADVLPVRRSSVR